MIYPNPTKFEEVMPEPNRQWAPFFMLSAQDHGLPAELVGAICWRESRGGSVLTPRGPEGTGDGGHGLGLMQIDGRYHQQFVAKIDPVTKKPLWKRPAANIAYGTQVLATGIRLFQESLEGGIACYNASPKRVMLALKEGVSVDTVTTNNPTPYVGEVLGYALKWHHINVDPVECRCILCAHSLT